LKREQLPYILLNQMNVTMKSKNFKNSFLMIALFSATAAMAQHKYVNTPPEVSPMPMKPEMTEIWEPEVKVITPGSCSRFWSYSNQNGFW
jgi:hypothetical protein